MDRPHLQPTDPTDPTDPTGPHVPTGPHEPSGKTVPGDVALVAPLVPGLDAPGLRLSRLVLTAGLTVGVLAAWGGAVPAAVLVAAVALPLALVVAPAAARSAPPASAGPRMRPGILAAFGGLLLGAVVTFGAARLLAPGAQSLGVLPWAPASLADAARFVLVTPVALVVSTLLGAACAGRGTPADRIRVAAVVGSGYAAGESVVRFAPLLRGGGQPGTDPAPWVLLVAVVGLMTPAVYAGASALAMASSLRVPGRASARGARRLFGLLAAALAWGGYVAATYGLAFVGGQPLPLLLTSVVGWFVAGLVGLRVRAGATLAARAGAPDPVPGGARPGESSGVAARRDRRALTLSGAVLLGVLVVGLVLGARSPALARPLQLDAPAGGTGDRTNAADLGDGVRVVLPSGWTIDRMVGSTTLLGHEGGLRAELEVGHETLDAVPSCDERLREAPRLFAASRTTACRQGSIVGRVDTAAGSLGGLHVGPLGGARVTELVGSGHRFEGLSIRLGILAPAEAALGEREAQAAQELYAAALTALDAAP
jgi:hypothetical protein